jgi:hypothetical protein
MLPSERKQKIDHVIGVIDAENAEKACKTEASAYKREAEALAKQLREPVAPPDEYHRASEEIEKDLNAGRQLRRTWDAHASQIKPVFKPEKPARARPSDTEIDDLHIHERERRKAVAEMHRLQGVLDRAFHQPQYTADEVEAAKSRNQLRKLLTNAIKCPHCEQEFVPGHGHVELPEGPDLTAEQIQQELLGQQMAREYAEARVARTKLKIPDDLSQTLDELVKLHEEWAFYDRQMAIYVEQNAKNETLEKQMEGLPTPPEQELLDELADELADARVYEAAVERYSADKVTFERISAEVKEKLRLADEFKKGAEAIQDARATIKANLAPIMSRIASDLITDMTHGKLTSVVVDENMEITVNGQRLETLSGGGETVANIALRLALGQTLVANTFPVFIGDEMDADADSVRREAVTQAMQALVASGRLKQVILVTHRSVENVDHVVDLGNTE